ncbi:NuA4 histone acetyltransferase subunit [Coemansia sp. RSA 1822]|nr:NuA4 histone acetyltransferase subunit [Coemansia sp. RSA 638]KAJ2119061.1 NuA4 histone acetyltransferase subunit [Coemansia sp. RSA 720]KAJ2545312.1 NuA4 histone acetyltransferase subunit [Coemansia sp. RSA 1853]KAJ2563460.1 NuA4 histone acetyltransferase subunit [Coemansia sp. RSA 1822]
MPTYGGDEVNALVLDVGSTWTRAGFAGEDLPKGYFPSHAGYIEREVTEQHDEPKSAPQDANGDTEMTSPNGKSTKQRQYFIGDTESSTWRPGMEVSGPLENGLVNDWDMYEKIWDYAFKTRLRVRPEEHPLLVSEAAWNTSEQRTKLVELAFERFNCPSFYVCKAPVMAAFGTGKHTALVLDVGGETMSACAVYEGFCLSKSVVHQQVGGELVSRQILDRLREDYAYEPTPVFDIQSKAAVEILKQPEIVRRNRPSTESFMNDMRMRTVLEFKEASCEVLERPFQMDFASAKPQKPFEFPDGFNISLGPMRFAVPEILFNPSQYIIKRPAYLDNAQLLGAHEMVLKSVMASDMDLRPHLLNSVVLAGGSTLFPGFVDRLSGALQEMCQGSRVKLHSPSSDMERKVTTWLGGSILASLGTFHQLWISRAEYDEHGASIVDKKCQ